MHKSLRRLTCSLLEGPAPGDEMKRKRSSYNDDVDTSHSGAREKATLKAGNTAGDRNSLNNGFNPSSKGRASNSSTTPEFLTQNILTLFPDICPDYVATLYKKKSTGKSHPSEDVLINAILEGESYPTLSDTKRRRLAENKGERKIRWGDGDKVKRDSRYWKSCTSLLKLDFPQVPLAYATYVLNENRCLYGAYLELDKTEAAYETLNPKPKDIKRELQDAREERRRRTVSRALKEQELEREAKNIADHAAIGGLVECGCCYEETPLNRMVSCSVSDTHLFCKRCMKSNAESQIGMMKFEIVCMDMGGCVAKFSRSALVESIGDALVNKIDDLRQRDEIEKASIEGLEECPFCEYKEIYPSIEEDREFRCLKPGCEKVSCRKCHGLSHIPKTCEEMSKEKRVPMRQKVEEAMSEAIIRICPNQKCKTPIIKEYGCNKMCCTKCSTLMCYICKKDITQVGYQHFIEVPSWANAPVTGKCMLHDGLTASRHDDEALQARQAALEKVLKENPDLKEEDIDIEAPKARNPRRAHDAAIQLPEIPFDFFPGVVPLPGNVPLPQPLPQQQPAREAVQPRARNYLPHHPPQNQRPQPPLNVPMPMPMPMPMEPMAQLAMQRHAQLAAAQQRLQAWHRRYGNGPAVHLDAGYHALAQNQLDNHQRGLLNPQVGMPLAQGYIHAVHGNNNPLHIRQGLGMVLPQNLPPGQPLHAQNPIHPYPPQVRAPDNHGSRPGTVPAPPTDQGYGHAQQFVVHYDRNGQLHAQPYGR
ncbi:IBR domain containing protein [Arthroderma uncinatum]|uniref:IBR domain containing protein n=1 Tax=Arthroderma uncinatum TaxID=74035 RepID=UPI00144A6B46|nr:IBR domain containing protein [Arthroderma uncinatum]KAF3482238.1 IBR domain containing protein [Arthroderma uncinatum]